MLPLRPILIVCVATIGWASFVFASPSPEGDKAFLSRHDAEKARQALSLFREAHEKEPQNSEAGYRHAMACQYVGYRVETDVEVTRALYEEGRDAGRSSVASAPECAPCHFWTAINMALYGESVGALKMLFTLGEIRTHLKKSVSLDPTYASAGALRVLGLIEWRLPGILGGDNDEARSYFEQALKLLPGEPMTTTSLVRLLEDEFSAPEEVKRLLAEALSKTRPSLELIESREAYDELNRHADFSSSLSQLQP